MKVIRNPKFGDELEVLPFEIGNPIYANFFGGVQAGFPSPADDFIDKKLSLDEKYLQDSNNTFIIKVKGLSMYPTLQIDDILIVKSDAELLNNCIAIISINNGEYCVKRYNKKKESFTSDNPEYAPVKVTDEDTLICLGIVKHIIRDI